MSNHRRLRNEHNAYAAYVTNCSKGPCAGCQRPRGSRSRVEGSKIKAVFCAHVTPVEEGARGIPGNLLPLCERGSIYLHHLEDVHPETVGCHKLYDNEGYWSRDSLQDITIRWWGGKKGRLKRPKTPEKKWTAREGMEWLIDRGNYPKAEKLLGSLENETKNRTEAFKANLLKLRLFRRSGDTELRKKIPETMSEIGRHYQDLRREYQRTRGKEQRQALESAEYEIAMGQHFPARCFKDAGRWLRRYKRRGKVFDAGRVVNETQALVADFEHLRYRNPLPTAKIRTLCRHLRKNLCYLDRFANKSGKAWLNRWRVTARLHLARTLAAINDGAGRSWLDAAIRVRNSQTKADGWSWYTTSLLLHARAECLCCEARVGTVGWSKALQALALSGRWIITNKYKDYEYIENVLERLLQVPIDGRNQTTSTMKATREALAKVRAFLGRNSHSPMRR